MGDAGIVSYGVYVPLYRIIRDQIAQAWGKKAKGENSVAGSDEDVVTMSFEASLNAIRHANIVSLEELNAVYFGTNSHPYGENYATGVLLEALGIKGEKDIAEFTASPRASIACLKAMCDALNAGRITKGLILGADSRNVRAGSRTEMYMGSAAAAFVLGKDEKIADIEGEFTFFETFLDKWRESSNPFLKEYDPRFQREYGFIRHAKKAAEGLLKKMNRKVEDYDHVVFQEFEPRITKETARAFGVNSEQIRISTEIFNSCGDTGAASSLLGLAAVLDKAKPKEKILLISYGSGASDAISILVRDEIERRRECGIPINTYVTAKEYIDYFKYIRFTNKLLEEKGSVELKLPPASSWMWRSGPELHRLLGNKCKNCGYINFPPSIRNICIKCGKDEFEVVVLPKKGKINTFCVNIYMPAGYEAPLPIIYVDLDNGSRLRLQGTELKPEEIKIGMPVDLVFRRVAVDRGISLYMYKVRKPRVKEMSF